MDIYEPMWSLGMATVAGLLIGFEREQSAPKRGQTGEASLGGVRTHPLVALVGALTTLLSGQLGPVLPLAAFAAVVVLLAISYASEVKRDDRGLTSEAAFLLSFLLGVLSASSTVLPDAMDRLGLVMALTVIVTLLLSIKPSLHALVQRVSHEDLFATLKFLLVAVVVLPMLPDHDTGPMNAFNPRSVGWMVVLITGVSFVGYVAVRWVGSNRGLAITGLVGGLVSSTAVTLTFSGRARAEPHLRNASALAVVLACGVMTIRVPVLVAITHSALLGAVLLPLGFMTAASGLVAVFLYRTKGKVVASAGEVNVPNPVELSSAVKFALLYAGVLFVSRLAHAHLGTRGVYLTGILAGTTDVDAITLSTARMAADGVLAATPAATAILLATAANTLVKCGIAVAVGGRAFARVMVPSFAVTLLAGALGLGILWLW